VEIREEGRRGCACAWPSPPSRRRKRGGAGVRDEVAGVTVGEVEMKKGERKPIFA
jgi:hypothetical protein